MYWEMGANTGPWAYEFFTPLNKMGLALYDPEDCTTPVVRMYNGSVKALPIFDPVAAEASGVGREAYRQACLKCRVYHDGAVYCFVPWGKVRVKPSAYQFYAPLVGKVEFAGLTAPNDVYNGEHWLFPDKWAVESGYLTWYTSGYRDHRLDYRPWLDTWYVTVNGEAHFKMTAVPAAVFDGPDHVDFSGDYVPQVGGHYVSGTCRVKTAGTVWDFWS